MTNTKKNVDLSTKKKKKKKMMKQLIFLLSLLKVEAKKVYMMMCTMCHSME